MSTFCWDNDGVDEQSTDEEEEHFGLGLSTFDAELSQAVATIAEDGCTETAPNASKSPFTAPSATDASEEAEEKPVSDWDIARGPRKQGKLGQLKMVLPAVTKIALSSMTGLVATGGYMMGKVGEKVGIHGKAVDSLPFQAGFISWLWTNGIFPTLRYEPLGEKGKALAEFYGVPELSEGDIRQTAVLVSNHICYLDGIVLAALFRAPRIIAMEGSRGTPVLGKLMEEMDVIFVERGSSDSRQKTLDGISSHCSGWKPGCKPLLIFPEGTTTNGEGLVEFRKGAFVAGIPVRPVIIVYTGQWNPATTNYVQTGEASEVEAFSDQEWGMQFLGHFIHSMHVRVLPPYVPTPEEQADAGLYARNCREYMQVELKRVRAELQTNYFVAAADSLLKDFGGYIDSIKSIWSSPIVASKENEADITLAVTSPCSDDQPKLISSVHAIIINPLVENRQVNQFHIMKDPPSSYAASPGSHMFLQLTVPCPWPYTMRDLNRWACEIGQDTKIQVVH